MLRVLGLCTSLALLTWLMVGCGGVQQQLSWTPTDPAAAPPESPARVTLVPVADTSLYEGAPGVNYGTMVRLYCGNYPDGKNRRGLMRFDLSAVPASATVTRATLRIYLYAVHQGTDQYRVHGVTKAWEERRATWSNMNASYDPAASAKRAIRIDLQGKYAQFNITSLVQRWVTTPSTNYGLLLRGTEGASHRGIVLGSREYLTPSWRPKLTVKYTP
jgi:hypothetical protein